jgi:hypothetical protein
MLQSDDSSSILISFRGGAGSGLSAAVCSSLFPNILVHAQLPSGYAMDGEDYFVTKLLRMLTSTTVMAGEAGNPLRHFISRVSVENVT